jgi:hypothetical protein
MNWDLACAGDSSFPLFFFLAFLFSILVNGKNDITELMLIYTHVVFVSVLLLTPFSFLFG